MELLNIIGSICSIVALIVSVAVYSKVAKMQNQVSVKGNKNLTAGRDVKKG